MKQFFKGMGLLVINVITFPITIIAYILGIIGFLVVGASFRTAYNYMTETIIMIYKNIWNIMRGKAIYSLEEIINMQIEKHLQGEES